MNDPVVRSGRTRPAVVVGDGTLAELLAVRLGATHVPSLPADAEAAAAAVAGTGTLVVVGMAAVFETDTARSGRHEQVLTLARDAVQAAAAVGARVVAVSSAFVCGTGPDRVVVADDDPVADAAAQVPGVVGTLAAFEREVAQGAAAAGVPLAVLRPAPLVGPGIDTFVTRHFEAPRLLAVRGTARDWQLLHVDDLAEAVRIVAREGLVGHLGVGALHDDGTPDVLPAQRVAALAGRRLLTLGESSAFALAESLHKVGAVPAHPGELAYVVYPWTVSAARLFAAGWRPGRSTAECVAVLTDGLRGGLTVGGRRVGARDAAALGAAGAAVALLGTAAVWRQARGHH